MDPAVINALASGSLASAMAFALKVIWNKYLVKEAEVATAATAATAREDAIRAAHRDELAKVREAHQTELAKERAEQKTLTQDLLDTLKGME